MSKVRQARRRRVSAMAGALAMVATASSPALAQQAPAAGPAPQAGPATTTAPGADQDFLLGLRRMGVIAGHAVACAPEGNRGAVIDSATDLAKQIAVYFGLNAAFHFVGAVGYGTGRPFDKATCSQDEQDWKSLQQKYMGQ